MIVGGCDGGLLEFYSADKLLSNASDALVASSNKHNGNYLEAVIIYFDLIIYQWCKFCLVICTQIFKQPAHIKLIKLRVDLGKDLKWYELNLCSKKSTKTFLTLMWLSSAKNVMNSCFILPFTFQIYANTVLNYIYL